MGVYLDESQVGPDTTVRRLASLVEEGSKRPPITKFPAWGMRLWARMMRGFLQQGLVFPMVGLAYSLRVTGRENLDGLNGPVLFASNHHLGLDNPLIFKAVTRKWRGRLAVAAAAELVAKSRLVGPQPSSRERISHRPGRPHQTESGKPGAHYGRRLVCPHLPGRRADGRRPHEAIYAGCWSGGCRRAGPGSAHAPGHLSIRCALMAPALTARTGGNSLRASYHLLPRHRLPVRHQCYRTGRKVPLMRSLEV